jgi:hypothetical protein
MSAATAKRIVLARMDHLADGSGMGSVSSVCSRRHTGNLCDFCNAPGFFQYGHTGAQIFCSDVAHLLQGVFA